MISEITPRTNTRLFGHEQVEAMLLRDLASGKLAHGIILSGAQGIGKATLAYRFARALLSGQMDMEISEDNPVFKRVAARSHTDLLVIEPLYDAKKDEYATEITIEQSRTIAQSLSLTPAEGQWRVVIIDSADALNNKSANAILKILEEPPPQTVIILITHNVGGLLPTIRSRCRLISLRPLSKQDFMLAMNHMAPEINENDLNALGVISGFSPGISMQMRQHNVLSAYDEIISLLGSLPNLDNQAILSFCEKIGSGKKAHANWNIFMHVMLCILERIAGKSAGTSIIPINKEDEEVLVRLSATHNAAVWATKWQEALNQFLLAQRLHLDYKQVALAFFHSLAGVEEFTLAS